MLERRGQRHQPRAVEVEGLRDVGSHVVAAAVAGHAEHRRGAGEAQPTQLLLQDNAIAVAAGQGDPRRHALIKDNRLIRVGGKSGRFWCSPTSTASQLGASMAAVAATSVASNGAQLKSVRISGAGTGGHPRDVTRPRHHLVKSAWTRPHFALAVGLDAAAWPELHALWTIVVDQLLTARHRHLPTSRIAGQLPGIEDPKLNQSALSACISRFMTAPASWRARL